MRGLGWDLGRKLTAPLDTRITSLEDTYVRACWFEEIASGTSGTLTLPTGGSVVPNQWEGGVDALASKVSSSWPSFESPVNTGGTVITATLGAGRSWTLSDTPSSYPVAIIYVYRVKLISFNDAYSMFETELEPSHTALRDIGTHTHPEIDTHLDGDGSDHADVVSNTGARHSQNSDTQLKSGVVAVDASDNVTLNQNTIAAFVSSAVGAIVNTLCLKAGKVGIGDIDPDYLLELLSTTSPQFCISNVDGTHYATFGVDGSGNLEIIPSSLETNIQRRLTSKGLQINAIIRMQTYSSASANEARMVLQKSHQNTEGYTATVDGESISAIRSYGVKSGNDGFSNGASIEFIQNGAAGVAYIPIDIIFETSNGTTAPTQQVKIASDGGIHMTGMKGAIDQATAEAIAGELWYDTNDDNTIKMGV